MAVPVVVFPWTEYPMGHLKRCVITITSLSSLHAVMQREYERLVKTCENDKVKLPTKRQLEKKAAQMLKLETQPMTEVRANT